MKLYRIIVLHGAPKDSHTSTETYLAAESDERVMAWIDENKCHGYWFDDSEIEYFADDNYEKAVSFKEWVLLNKGDLSDENGWEDSYYGVTKWGWEEVVGATPADIKRLLALGIAEKAGK